MFGRRRPGLRAGILTISALLVVGTAFAVSQTVSGHLAQAAVHEAVRTTEAVVLADLDPNVTEAAMADPSGPEAATLNEGLQRLVSGGKILRIKIWDAGRDASSSPTCPPCAASNSRSTTTSRRPSTARSRRSSRTARRRERLRARPRGPLPVDLLADPGAG